MMHVPMNPHHHRQAVWWSAASGGACNIQIQTTEFVKFIGMLRGQVLLRDRVPNSHLGKWAEWPGTCISFRGVSGVQTHTRILSRPTCHLAMLLRVLPVEIWPELSHMEFHDIARRFQTPQALVLAQIRVQEPDESYWK